MTTELLILSGARACLIAICGLISVHLLPQTWVTARRGIALAAVWSLLLLPWIPLSLPMVLPGLARAQLPALHIGATLTATLPLVWCLGVLFRICRLGAELCLLRRMVRAGKPCGDHMLIVEELSTPCMWGVTAPSILMPAIALDWSSTQWRAAMLHEQQHIRQHDGLHRMVAALIRCAFWWNPLVHALCRRLEIESELRCDEAATVASGRRAYGEMLLNLATNPCFETMPAWAAGSVRERIQRLAAPTNCSRTAAAVRTLMILGVLAAGLVAGCCVEGYRKAAVHPGLGNEAALRLAAEAFPLH